ncbi:MAG: HAD family hydrolase [Pseudomonadota bacterium]
MANIRTIGFDADDTLWHNENHFQSAHADYVAVMSDYLDADAIEVRLLETERKNLSLYGYGVKPFTLSMMETALEITENQLDANHVRQILEIGRNLLLVSVELLPEVAQTIDQLAQEYELVLITKGDLKDQERKIAESELAGHFAALEIVSDKTDQTYRQIFNRHAGIDHSVMIGNSMKSDILPALNAGAYAAHVPYHITWALEEAHSDGHEKLILADSLVEAAEKIRSLG